MSTRLPERIDPRRLADRGVRLSGELPCERMERLLRAVHQATGMARVDLAFDRETDGRARIVGRIEAEVQLTCQRCLSPVGLRIERDVGLIVVETGAPVDDPVTDMDPLVCGDQALALLDIAEDELLLALPQEAKHGRGRCAEQHRWSFGDPERTGETEHSGNPFAALAQLKKHN